MQRKKAIALITIQNSDDHDLKCFKTATTADGSKMPINPKMPLVFESIDVGYEGYTLVPNKLYVFNQTVDVVPQANIEQDSLLRMLGFDVFVNYMPVRDENGNQVPDKVIVSVSFDVVEPVLIFPDTIVASLVKMVEVDEHGNEIVEQQAFNAMHAENTPVPMEMGPSEA